MKIETPVATAEFPMPKADLVGKIVAGVAQYGVSVIINSLGKSIIVGGKVHQRIAMQVAAYIVVWACQRWIKNVAIEFTADVIEAAQTIIAMFKGAKVA